MDEKIENVDCRCTLMFERSESLVSTKTAAIIESTYGVNPVN